MPLESSLLISLVREEFKPNKPRPCELCGQTTCEGLHKCNGAPKPLEGQDVSMEEKVNIFEYYSHNTIFVNSFEIILGLV